MVSRPEPRRLQLEQFNKLWVVEYSIEQNAFHVRTVNEMLDNNRKNLAGRISSDYAPVAFTASREKAIALSESLRDNLSQQIKISSQIIKTLEFSEDDLWAFFRSLDSEQ